MSTPKLMIAIGFGAFGVTFMIIGYLIGLSWLLFLGAILVIAAIIAALFAFPAPPRY